MRDIRWSSEDSHTKANDAKLQCLLWSAPEQTVGQTIEKPVFWGDIAFIMLSLLHVCSKFQFHAIHMWTTVSITLTLTLYHCCFRSNPNWTKAGSLSDRPCGTLQLIYIWFNTLRQRDAYMCQSTGSSFGHSLSPNYHLDKCYKLINWRPGKNIQWNSKCLYNVGQIVSASMP